MSQTIVVVFLPRYRSLVMDHKWLNSLLIILIYLMYLVIYFNHLKKQFFFFIIFALDVLCIFLTI